MLKDYNKKSLVILEYLFKIELYINKCESWEGDRSPLSGALVKKKKIFFPLFCML